MLSPGRIDSPHVDKRHHTEVIRQAELLAIEEESPLPDQIALRPEPLTEEDTVLP